MKNTLLIMLTVLAAGCTASTSTSGLMCPGDKPALIARCAALCESTACGPDNLFQTVANQPYVSCDVGCAGAVERAQNPMQDCSCELQALMDCQEHAGTACRSCLDDMQRWKDCTFQ